MKHESEYTLDIVRTFGIEDEDGRPPFISVLQHETLKTAAILKAHGIETHEPIVAVHPGASCESKKWPIERFAALGKKMIAETSYRFVVIGGKEEAQAGQFLKKEWGDRAVDLTGQLTLKTLAALLKRCDILISNDSGPVHISAAVGTRTFVIFGRNQSGLSAARWRALGVNHRSIQKDVGCVVCMAHRCTIGFECLKAVDVHEVWLQVQEMLALKKPLHSSKQLQES